MLETTKEAAMKKKQRATLHCQQERRIPRLRQDQHGIPAQPHYYRVVLWSHEPELWRQASGDQWFERLHGTEARH